MFILWQSIFQTCASITIPIPIPTLLRNSIYLFRFRFKRMFELIVNQENERQNSERDWNSTTCHSTFLIFILCFKSTIYSNLCTHLHVYAWICMSVMWYVDTFTQRWQYNGKKMVLIRTVRLHAINQGKKGIFNTHAHSHKHI